MQGRDTRKQFLSSCNCGRRLVNCGPWMLRQCTGVGRLQHAKVREVACSTLLSTQNGRLCGSAEDLDASFETLRRHDKFVAVASLLRRAYELCGVNGVDAVKVCACKALFHIKSCTHALSCKTPSSAALPTRMPIIVPYSKSFGMAWWL